MDRGAWRAADHGVTKGQTQLKRLCAHAQTLVSKACPQLTLTLATPEIETRMGPTLGHLFALSEEGSGQHRGLAASTLTLSWLLPGVDACPSNGDPEAESSSAVNLRSCSLVILFCLERSWPWEMSHCWRQCWGGPCLGEIWVGRRKLGSVFWLCLPICRWLWASPQALPGTPRAFGSPRCLASPFPKSAW